MKLIKNKRFWTLGVLILLSIIIMNGCLNNLINVDFNEELLKISYSPIDVTSPANKSYSAPMIGYFPATYGFENDIVGGPPSDWILNSMDGSSFVEVDSNLAGHNNIVEIRKNGGTASAGMSNDFNMNVTLGAIEFWLYKDTDSGTDATFLSVVSLDGLLGNAQAVILNGDLYYMPSNFASRILIASNIFIINTWHHVRLEFNITQGWQIVIDGTLYGQNYALPFRDGVTGNPMVRFNAQSLFSGGHPNYGSWVDAVSYSWDPRYTIGDNTKEGLLLSFSPDELVWMGYSLDGLANITIWGNVSIPYPSNGSHTIQVFGNSTIGDQYQSEIRHFTIYGAPSIPKFEFASASKQINIGSQEGTWDEYNIRYNDTNYDTTKFALDSNGIIVKQDANVVHFASGGGYSTTGGLKIEAALATLDNQYLIDGFVMGLPAIVGIIWGGYTNFASNLHQYIYQVRIDYSVMCEAFLGLDIADDLRLVIIDDLAAEYNHYITPDTPDGVFNPPGVTHGYHYTSAVTLSSGAIFNRIKAGGYIPKIGLLMDCYEPLGTAVWMNVDYIKITYYYYNVIDFEYELDYGGFGLSNIPSFKYTIDAEDTPSGTSDYLQVFLRNFDTLQWDFVASIEGLGRFNGSIMTDADSYFDDNYKFKIRFIQTIYYETQPVTDHFITLDLIEVSLSKPDPPPNFKVDQEILHIFLSWDVPNGYGLPITKYNIYRGEIQGGTKSLIGTSLTNYYNDTDVIVGTSYYYFVSAETILGEGSNSSEESGKAYDQPFVEWVSPEEGDTVLFPYNASDDFNEWKQFHFEYDWAELDNVTLEINGTDYGSVWNKTYIRLFPYINGTVTATLFGYNNTILKTQDTILFEFVNIDFEVMDNINESIELLGKQLYLILHDPHGDNSYSSFSETTSLSIGVGIEAVSEVGVSVELGHFQDLEYAEVGASAKLSFQETIEQGFEYRYEITDVASLTSSLEESDPDYIGPGYGDTYWGESWILKWVLNASWREYSNGTKRWERPQLYYGMIRDAETIVGDDRAPEEWKKQNYFYNNSINATWLRPLSVAGVRKKSETHQVTTTETRSFAITLDFGFEFKAKFPVVIETLFTINLKTKNYVESGQASTHEVMFEIYDDDATDFIVQGLGIDNRFGTYLFNSSAFFCETSQPLEHNTYDYLPPILGYPLIDLDSNNDGYAPSNDDSPIITIGILEEGGVQEAIIRYSINNGSTWEIVHLHELPASPGTYEGVLPAQPVNTKVIWYIQVWDNQGHNSTRYDNYGNPFEYVVIGKPTEAAAIPGFPVGNTIVMITSVIIVIIIYHRKRFKSWTK